MVCRNGCPRSAIARHTDSRFASPSSSLTFNSGCRLAWWYNTGTHRTGVWKERFRSRVFRTCQLPGVAPGVVQSCFGNGPRSFDHHFSSAPKCCKYKTARRSLACRFRRLSTSKGRFGFSPADILHKTLQTSLL